MVCLRNLGDFRDRGRKMRLRTKEAIKNIKDIWNLLWARVAIGPTYIISMKCHAVCTLRPFEIQSKLTARQNASNIKRYTKIS